MGRSLILALKLELNLVKFKIMLQKIKLKKNLFDKRMATCITLEFPKEKTEINFTSLEKVTISIQFYV